MSRKEEKRIKAVIFDLDDTLIDWSQRSATWDEFTRPMVDGVYQCLLDDGHELPDRDAFFELWREQVESIWEAARTDWMGPSFGKALRLTVDGCGVDIEQVDMDELARAYSWGPMPGVELYADATTVLEHLRQVGYKLGLITNSFLPMWMRDVELRHYELIDFFDARTTSGDAGYMKPHPAIYLEMLESLAVRPEEAVFVGDRPDHDIAGANEAGLISVLMDPPHLERDLDGVVPDYTITTLSELLPILERLENESE